MSVDSERVAHEYGLHRAVLAGDEGAWRAWYDATFADLFAYLQWRCGGRRDVAEEIVQEVWLVAIRRIRDFQPEKGRFLDWLRGIAAQLLRNRYRRETRRPPPTPNEVHAEAADEPALRHEAADRVARALAALSERQEAVLRAKYLEGRSVLDIATAWQETPKALESLLTRARDAFRDAYGSPE